MNRTRFTLTMITVLMILCFTFSSVGADFALPQQSGTQQGGAVQPPDLSQFTVRPDDYTPPVREIQADPYQKPEPISPKYESVFTKLPRYFFYRDFLASEYQVQVWDIYQNIEVDSLSGTGDCSDYYCSLLATTKLKVERYQNDRGLYSWKVRARVNGVWQGWSTSVMFAVLSTGFNDSFNLIPKKWWQWNSSWFWSGTKGTIKTSGELDRYNSVYHEEYFGNFDYTVRMKRKLNAANTNGVVVWGQPDPVTADNMWHSGLYFTYANAGYVSLWKSNNGVYEPVFNGYSDAIVPYGWNEIRIVGNYPWADLWINGTYLGWYVCGLSSGGWGLVGVDMFASADGETFIVDSAKLVAFPFRPTLVHDPAQQLGVSGVSLELAPNTAP